MGFKAEYRKRREAGLRGQGEEFNPKGKAHSSPDWPRKPVSKKAMLKNTKRARKAVLYGSNEEI
jgi:hypothetical protein